MLTVVQDKITMLYAFLWQVYRHPSNLYFNTDIILSHNGVQQGDPLGPLLFSLTLHPIISKLKSNLHLFYLDDGILLDDPQCVLSDLQSLSCESIGLDINIKKCELLFFYEPDSAILSSLCDFAPGIQIPNSFQI